MMQLSIGIENFKELIDNKYYFIDKSDLIKGIIKEKVAVYTRPRRFGKTLTMSMLYYFFSIEEKSNAYLFDGLKIAEYPDILQFQNQYPVILISMKDLKSRTMKCKLECSAF